MKTVNFRTPAIATVETRPRAAGLYRVAFVALSIQIIALGWPAVGANPRIQADTEEKNAAALRVEKRQAQRMANAQPTRLVSSHYSIAGGDETTLYLLNKVSEPIEVEVEALSGEGVPLSLGRYVLEPTQHTALSLSQLLGVTRSYRTGSLRVDFMGDAKMVQAWAVLRRGQNVVELPLQASADQGWQRISFWDTRMLDKNVVPHYFVINSSEFPVNYEVHLGQDDDGIYEQRGTLLPGAREAIIPTEFDTTLRHGWFWLELEGPEPGAVTAVGLLQASRKPIAVASRAAGPRQQSTYLSRLELAPSVLANSFSQFASLAIPLRTSQRGEARTLLSLFNGAEQSAIADVVLVDFDSGEELVRRQVTLAPNEVSSMNLNELAADTLAELPEEGRVYVEADTVLRLWSASELPNGNVLEVPFFGLTEAHQSGSYPLPDLDNFHTVSTLVNVGDEPTTILGQVSWDNGTYALKPLDIPAGEARHIDFTDLVLAQTPDIVGRKIEPDFRQGFFQWTARGSHQVIGRTDVRPINGTDRFGFNCGSCCQEESFGDILPGSIMINFNSSSTFDGVEYVGTCTSILGPYSISGYNSLSYSSPVTWNGHSLSVSDLTDQRPAFTAWGDSVFDDGWECTQGNVLFGDDDRVQADPCQEQHNPPPFDPARSCGDQNSSCSSCKNCCEKQKDVGDCRCSLLPFGVNTCKTGVKVACQNCKINSCVCSGSNLC